MGIVTNSLRKIYRLKNLNLEIRPFRNSGSSKFSEILLPNCNYAPWKKDDHFLRIYNIIRNYTLVDIYRNYELWDIVGQLATSIEGNLIEIGVWRGGTAGVMASKLKEVNSDKKIYLADTFTGVVKASESDTKYVGGEHSDTSEKIVDNLLSNTLGLRNFEILKGIFPEDSSHLIEDQKFCFCHIDVDVYLSCKDIMEWIWPKLSIGGVVVYDDYGFTDTDGVIKFVEEEKLKKDRLITYNLNGHAVMIKLK